MVTCVIRGDRDVRARMLDCAVELLGERARARARAAASSPTAHTMAGASRLTAASQAVGAADHERDVARRHRASVAGDRRARASSTARRARRARRPRSPRHAAAMRVASAASICGDGLAAVARLGLELDQLERELARHAPRVVVVSGARPTRASGGRARRGEASRCARARSRRRHAAARSAVARALRGRPQLLEVVVRAHGRLHDVDDDVAGIDQHPLAGLARPRRRGSSRRRPSACRGRGRASAFTCRFDSALAMTSVS